MLNPPAVARTPGEPGRRAVTALTGMDGDDILTANPAALEGGTFEGGLGNDTLSLSEGEVFDLALPEVFTSIETVTGSDHWQAAGGAGSALPC